MDAITMLKDDHKDVERLFKRFEKAGPRAFVTKREVVDQIIEALAVHAAIEEQVFYPAARAEVPDCEPLALESIEEHDVAKWLLADLERMSPEDERFDAKVAVLIDTIRRHVEEEESELFPAVRAELGRSHLQELGELMATAREVAPTHAHPRSPSTPPGNLVIGTLAGVVDRAGDTVLGIAQGTVTAARDLVAKAVGWDVRSPAPTGSSTARSTATRVRDAAAGATASVSEAVGATQRAGERVIDAAKDGLDRTTTTAKRSATTTRRTARSGAKATATSARRGADEIADAAKAKAS